MSRKDNNTRKLSFLGFGTQGDGTGNGDEVQLDTEMEKVFAGPESADKFDLSKLQGTDQPENIPLKSISPEDSKFSQSPTSDSFTSTGSTAPSSPTAPLAKLSSATDEPLISQRTGYGEHFEDDSKHVAFDKKDRKESLKGDDDLGEDSADQKQRRKERHGQKHRKYSLTEYGGFRQGERRVSVQPEDQALKEADIDELTSHRSDDPRGMRRPRVQSPGHQPHTGHGENVRPKKAFDHSPHEVFVQLDELIGSGEDREWKETARWIKYEEDLEEGADRWGKPHVAPLSFHSLLNLRRCLETGVVLLDLEEKDIASVAYRITEQMALEELIHEDDKPIVLRSLLLKHRRVNEHPQGGFHFGGKRKYSSYTSLQNLNDDKSTRVKPPSTDPAAKGEGSQTTIDMKEEVYTSSQEDLKKAAHDTIFKRIPQGAEATTVLVGSVDFLEQPTIAFVRLAEGIQMPSITEVPVPVRFLFILLGPKTADLDYHEVGRSIATLMSSAHFHNIAYKAEDRKELLSAINEFLDDSIVIPPGDWASQNLLPFDELKAKKDMIRTRKTKALAAKNKEKEITVEEEKKLLAAADGDDGDGYQKPKKDPLERTHRLWGGLINDVKRRYPMYKSDILDGLNTETLAATIFMYFAALSTAITFGGLASDKTNNLIGISETLVSASMTGIFFHALCGQPLTIIGTTGPLLLFDEALYNFCKDNNFDFLVVRVYIGMWLVVIALVVSAFEGSVVIRWFTRFTQELFSALITLIYIVETIQKLFYVFGRHPLHAEYVYKPDEPIDTPYSAALTNTEPSLLQTATDAVTTLADEIQTNITTTISSVMDIPKTTVLVQEVLNSVNQTLLPSSDAIGPLNQPNTALFCFILCMGTFSLAYYLKLFRNSHFLGRNARRALGDFGVPISIAIFVLIDYMLPQVYTDKLTVPEGLSPSDPERRGWIIPTGPLPVWVPFVAGIPAMLVYILVFMETHISELIVDKPERGLKKGSGLHMDIVLLCFLNLICGFFGMPWHCAATVRSVTHVSAVTIMSTTHAPGDKPHIKDVKEQRISGFVVSVLVGLSVTMAPLLRKIPMSVLFGVFFYMGIASMSGVQLFDRLRLFLMPVKHHPSLPFVRKVPTWKMHLFTAVQFLSLGILWAVKSSKFSLAFPFFLILLVPIRQKLGQFYSETELNALDGSQAHPDAEDEPDFYEQAPIPA